MFQTTNQIIIIYIYHLVIYIYIYTPSGYYIYIYIYIHQQVPWQFQYTDHLPDMPRTFWTFEWWNHQDGRHFEPFLIITPNRADTDNYDYIYNYIYNFIYIYRWHTITILYKHYYRLKPRSKKYVTQLAYFILRPASQIDTTDTTDTRFFASWLPLQSAAWVCDDHLHLPWFQLESKPTDSEFHSGTNKLMFIVDTESYYLCKTHKEHSHSWIFRSVSPCGAAAFLNGSYGWSPCHGCPNFLRPARGVDACHLQM